MEPAWAGPLMQTYEVPNGNPLLAGTVGQVTTLRGTDPLPYASGVLRSWMLPDLTPDPAAPNFWPGTSVESAPGDPDSPPWYQTMGLILLFTVVALIVLGVGLNAFVKGD